MSALRSEVRRTFTPPQDRLKVSKANGAEGMLFAQRAVFGFTTIEYRNRITGRLSFKHILGDQTVTPSSDTTVNPAPWRIEFPPEGGPL